MQTLTFNLTTNVEGRNVWVTRVVNEPRFVAVKHAVKTQREELSSVAKLNRLFARFVVKRVIHVEQKAQACKIVVTSPHIALLLGDDFSSILTNKRTLLNIFNCIERPHYCALFSHSADLYSVNFLIICLHQIVQTQIFVATTFGMALAKSEHFIQCVRCTVLSCNKCSCQLTKFPFVCWFEQFSIPSVTTTLF